MKESPPAHCKSKYRVRVRFGETDLMGIVHHGTYISYFEVGRVEYMRRRGGRAESERCGSETALRCRTGDQLQSGPRLRRRPVRLDLARSEAQGGRLRPHRRRNARAYRLCPPPARVRRREARAALPGSRAHRAPHGPRLKGVFAPAGLRRMVLLPSRGSSRPHLLTGGGAAYSRRPP